VALSAPQEPQPRKVKRVANGGRERRVPVRQATDLPAIARPSVPIRSAPPDITTCHSDVHCPTIHTAEGPGGSGRLAGLTLGGGSTMRGSLFGRDHNHVHDRVLVSPANRPARSRSVSGSERWPDTAAARPGRGA
jgi:hypothetical protein